MNSNQNQSYCLRGRLYSQTKNQNINEKVNPKTSKVVEIIKETCSVCGRNKSQISTN